MKPRRIFSALLLSLGLILLTFAATKTCAAYKPVPQSPAKP